MIRIFYWRRKCIGCNTCVETDPHRWAISRKDGKSILLGAKEKKGIYHLLAGEDEWEKAKQTAANCPVKIIRVEK